jgi:uncharacterized protein
MLFIKSKIHVQNQQRLILMCLFFTLTWNVFHVETGIADSINQSACIEKVKKYFEGKDNISPVNIGSSIRRGWQSAKAGDWKSQNNLGLLFSIGDSVPTDHGAAYCLMQIASKNSSNSGSSNTSNGGSMTGAPDTTLGWWHLTGKFSPTVPKNDALAFSWSKKGADKGHPGAFVNLALMYATGLSGKIDLKSAQNMLENAVKAFDENHSGLPPKKWSTFIVS